MALKLESLLDDSKILRKTQDEKGLVQYDPRNLVTTILSTIIT
jgi:hypothetical protein